MHSPGAHGAGRLARCLQRLEEHGRDPAHQLSLLDNALNLTLDGVPAEERGELLARLHGQRADALREMDDMPGAVAALRAASMHETDPELRKAAAEYAQSLEQAFSRNPR